MPYEDIRCQTEVLDRTRLGQVSSSGLTTNNLQLRKVISPSFNTIWVFLDSIESPLGQEYIHMPEEDIRCQTKVLDRVRPGQVSSSIQVSSSGLTTHDLQLRKVISPSFELRFGCSLTLLKAH